MKRIIILITLLYTNSAFSSTCFENTQAPINTINNYYSDLKKKDISLLAKYFIGPEYRELEKKTKTTFSQEDYDKYHSELLFGVFSVCRVAYKVECASNNTAIVTYTGKKEGTQYESNDSVWLHQENGKWLIGKKRLVVSSSEKYNQLISQNNIKCKQ